MPRCLVIGSEKYLFNCWKSLKTVKLQRRHEIQSSVNVMKVEKIYCMIYGVILSIENNGQSAAKLRIEEGSTTIPYGSRTTSDW